MVQPHHYEDQTAFEDLRHWLFQKHFLVLPPYCVCESTFHPPLGSRGQKVRHLPDGSSDLIHGSFCPLNRIREHI